MLVRPSPLEDAHVAKERSAAKRPLTADDLFRITVVSDPQASPDGRQVAWVCDPMHGNTFEAGLPTPMEETRAS